jgi:ABC-type Fe3+ transport system substrate-binding protein
MTMNLIKRPLYFFMFILLIAGSVACSSDKENNTSEPAPTAPTEVSTPEPAPVEEVPSEEAEWQKVLEAAKGEALKIIVQPGVQDATFVEDFMKAYPELNVEFMGLRPSDAGPRIITEQQNSTFYWDIMVAATSNMVNVLGPADAFQDITPFLPNHSDDEWNAGFELYAQNVTNKPWTFLFTTDLHTTLYVNRDQLTLEQFDNVEDLLDPAYKGKIVIHTPKSQATGSLALAGILNIKGEEFIKELLTTQEPIFVDDQSIAADWVADGRYPIGIGLDRPRLQELQSAGVGKSIERLDFPGQSTLSRGMSVFRNNPSPNATKVFVNWVLSDEGQTSYATNRNQNSRKKSIEPVDPEIYIDWSQYNNYSLQGTEKGSDQVLRVIEIYKENY